MKFFDLKQKVKINLDLFYFILIDMKVTWESFFGILFENIQFELTF